MSQTYMSIISLLPSIGDKTILHWSGLQWRNILTNFMKHSHVVKETEVATHHGSVTSLLEKKVGEKCHYMTFPFWIHILLYVIYP
jgi:hypothetical protein